MEEQNIKHTFLYRTCFVFAILDVLGLLGFIAYLGNKAMHTTPIMLLLVLLAFWVYNLYLLWKPRLAGVKFFLVMRVAAFAGGLIYFLIQGFEPLVPIIIVLLLQLLIARLFYKLLLNMPFEY